MFGIALHGVACRALGRAPELEAGRWRGIRIADLLPPPTTCVVVVVVVVMVTRNSGGHCTSPRSLERKSARKEKFPAGNFFGSCGEASMGREQPGGGGLEVRNGQGRARATRQHTAVPPRAREFEGPGLREVHFNEGDRVVWIGGVCVCVCVLFQNATSAGPEKRSRDKSGLISSDCREPHLQAYLWGPNTFPAGTFSLFSSPACVHFLAAFLLRLSSSCFFKVAGVHFGLGLNMK